MAYTVKYPDFYSFVKNPIKVTITGSSAGKYQDYTRVSIYNFKTQQILFTKIASFFNGLAHVFIDDFLKTYTKYNPDYPSGLYDTSLCVRDYNLKITVEKPLGNVIETFTSAGLHAVLGGISNTLYKRMAAQNTNVFNAVFFSDSLKNILSNRGKTIVLTEKEAKACPLYFFFKENLQSTQTEIEYYENGNSIKVSTDTIIPSPIISSTQFIYPLNIMSILETLEIPHIRAFKLSIKRNNNPINQIFITIVEPKTAGQSRVILFRNSFDVFEAIEVTGNFSCEFQKEQIINKQYNSTTNSFEDKKTESPYKILFSGSAGYRYPSQNYFINDLYNSTEVYLLDEESNTLEPIILTSESSKYWNDTNEPYAAKIEFYLSTNENAFTNI